MVLAVARVITGSCILLTLIVVLLGGWTRINNAGLSCPDWPGCYGELLIPVEAEIIERVQRVYPGIPFEKEKVWLEMGHRYLAGSLGVMIALLAVIGWKLRYVPKYPFKIGFVLLGLVGVQALFGKWTVTMGLLPQVVTVHLLGGLLTLSLLILFWYRLTYINMEGVKTCLPYVRSWVGAGVALLLMQILLGGWVSSNYAGLACEHWLLCNPNNEVKLDFVNGFSLPRGEGGYLGGVMDIEARAAIQVVHRVGALLVMMYCLMLYYKYSQVNILKRPLQLLVFIMFLQIALGVLNVLYALPMNLAMLHHMGAVCFLFVALCLYSRAERIVEEKSYG